MNSQHVHHLCVCVSRIGPYHAARLSAAARHGHLSVVETRRTDSTYAWDEIAEDGAFARRTLFQNNDPGRRGGAALRQRMFQQLDELRPTVVAVTGWSVGDALAAISWCVSRKVPIVVMSESQERDLHRTWGKEAIKRQIVQLCSAGLAGGTPHVDYLLALGLPRERILMGYDVVDNEHFARGADAARQTDGETRRNLNLPERYFLASNRFIEKKNLPTLLTAYSNYRKQFGAAGWQLVLLGDGPLKNRLRQQCSDLGIKEHVHFPGFQQYDVLPAYYGLAEAFVHASTVEQWGLVVNEAMAAGLPVLVSEACGSSPDLVHPGVNGNRFNPFRIDELTRCLLDISHPDANRVRMGQASREIISRWTPERFAINLWQAAETAAQHALPRATLMQRLVLRSLSFRS